MGSVQFHTFLINGWLPLPALRGNLNKRERMPQNNISQQCPTLPWRAAIFSKKKARNQNDLRDLNFRRVKSKYRPHAHLVSSGKITCEAFHLVHICYMLIHWWISASQNTEVPENKIIHWQRVAEGRLCQKSLSPRGGYTLCLWLPWGLTAFLSLKCIYACVGQFL